VLPLNRIATGFLIASFAITINGFDFLIDAVGWLLVALGLSHMEKTIDPVFGKARLSAFVTLAISFAALIGLTANGGIGLLYRLSVTVTIWLVAEGIITRARIFDDASTASTFNVLRWILAIVPAINLLLAYTTTWLQGLAVILAVVGFIAIAWFIIRLYRSAYLRYLL
jgi:hypothetical protein